MKTTPVKTITLYTSAALAAVSIVCIFVGWHLVGNITGAAASCNLLAGLLLKKY